jgi:arsenate reductase (thioredoxin)
MKEIGVDISEQHSKGVKESLKEHFSYVITVSDDSRERSPVWPFTGNLFHWSIADPERVSGSSEQKRDAFRHVRDEISWKVREFLARLHGNQWSPNRATGWFSLAHRESASKEAIPDLYRDHLRYSSD